MTTNEGSPTVATGPGKLLHGRGRLHADHPSTSRQRLSTRSFLLIVGVGIAVAVGLRLALLPARGHVNDTDEFARWIGRIASGDLGHAYDIGLSYPPVMIYLFDLLGSLVSGFRTATDATDVGLRVAMKVPSFLADLGMAACVAYLLRARPGWAAAAAIGVLLMPPIWYLSAWWGQFDSIYILLGLAAATLAISGHHRLAVVLLALSLMAKPQALAFVIPFGAYWLGRLGWRQTATLSVIGVVVVVLVWLPFLGAGGPAAYLESVRRYQEDVFGVLSSYAWNAWWPLQQAVAGRGFYSDGVAVAGALTPRLIGYALAGLALLLVARAVRRRPEPEMLLLGMAAGVLVAFTFLTAMHERYVYGAVVFLAPLIPDRRILALWLVVGATAWLDLLAAGPPTGGVGSLVPMYGPLSTVGSLVTLGSTGAALLLLVRVSSADAPFAVLSRRPADADDSVVAGGSVVRHASAH
jgi:hypothetical protein